MKKILKLGIMGKKDMERLWLAILLRRRPKDDPKIWMESVEEIQGVFSQKSLSLLRSLRMPKTLADLVLENSRSKAKTQQTLRAFSQIHLIETFTGEDGVTLYQLLADTVQIEIPLSPASYYGHRPQPDMKSTRRWILRNAKRNRHSLEMEKTPENETPRQRWQRICEARAWVYSSRAGIAFDRYEITATKTHDEEAMRQYEELSNIDSRALKQIYWDLAEYWGGQALKWRRKAQCFDEKTGQGSITLVPTGQPEPTLQIGSSILKRVGADGKTVFRVETDGGSIILTPVEEVDNSD